ncbi:hypothetical protein X765_13625 [Mesorhizobium sp. LSHC440B00]|nr:hypothetical protein X765_13625 [Mesorhizobium sp. LSHC440B00]ESX37781.1 hypothetical protein X763_13310 [Mesorhizobium sp. LSHC432A00]ESX43256.1 hypothetical protein X764_07405 [Mesorhizobium sp. LSHC440A00]
MKLSFSCEGIGTYVIKCRFNLGNNKAALKPRHSEAAQRVLKHRKLIERFVRQKTSNYLDPFAGWRMCRRSLSEWMYCVQTIRDRGSNIASCEEVRKMLTTMPTYDILYDL